MTGGRTSPTGLDVRDKCLPWSSEPFPYVWSSGPSSGSSARSHLAVEEDDRYPQGSPEGWVSEHPPSRRKATDSVFLPAILVVGCHPPVSVDVGVETVT